MNNKTIPPAIITAATAILQPYFPDLSAAGLIESLQNRPKAAEGAEQQFFTREEVATMYKVTIATVDNWIKAGYLTAVRTGRRYIRITAASVKAFTKAK